jgi:hypothetical protein
MPCPRAIITLSIGAENDSTALASGSVGVAIETPF